MLYSRDGLVSLLFNPSREGNVLISVLRQIRSGFPARPESAPWSLALVGMRDVRDHKIAMDGRDGPTGGSPFNIRDRSLLLRDFTSDEVAVLYAQHTIATGQPVDDGLAQLDGYLAGLGLATGWLVIFDMRPGQPAIAERTTAERRTSPGGRAIAVVRA